MNEGICIINVIVSLTMVQNHSDIKMNNLLYSKTTRPFVTRFCMFCAFTRPRCQISVYRTIGPLVSVTRTFVVFLRKFSSSSVCLGKAALFHCGTPWTFHILIFV